MSDSIVIRFFNKAADLILLNLLWIVSCIPLVTIGAATCAMYYVCITSIRQGDGYVVKRFVQSFRKNWKQATILWLIIVILGAVFYSDLFFWYQMGTDFSKIMFCLSAMIAFMIGVIALYVFPVSSKFYGSLFEIVKNSAAFAVGYFPYTIILLAFSGAFLYVNLISIGMNAISLLIGFALLAYMKSFFYYRIFMNHMEERYDDFINEI